MSEETTTKTLDHGKTVIPIPGLKKDGWTTDSRAKKKDRERVVTLTEEATGKKHILTLRGHDELDLNECSVSVTREEDELVVIVKQIEKVKKEGSGEIDFSLESIEPGMEPEPESPEAEEPEGEEPEEQPEAEPESDSEEAEDLPGPVLLPEPVPTAVPEPSAILTVVGVNVDLHLHNHGKGKDVEVPKAKPEKSEPLEVYAGPIKRPQPLPTPGPVTTLPNKRRPAPHVEEEPRKPTGPPPAGAPGSYTERHAKLQEEHDRKLAEAALRRRRRANRDARRRERQAARAAWWKEWREAREERRRERPVRIWPSPATLVLILVIAVGIAIVVAGIFGAIAFFGNNDGGHHEVTGVENTPPEDPDPPVSTPPPEDPDPPVSDPTPSEPEPTEEPEETEPTNTPTEVAPGHIEIILPAGNEWSVAVNTGEEYEIEYSFTGNKSGAEVMIGNGAYGPLDLDWREVNGPFKFRGEEGTKISIKWSPSS